MTRDERIEQLEDALVGRLMKVYDDAQHQLDLQRLGMSFRTTQRHLREWCKQYRDTLLLPPGEINVPPAAPAAPAKVPVLPLPARPPITQPKPAANGNGHYQPQKVK